MALKSDSESRHIGQPRLYDLKHVVGPEAEQEIERAEVGQAHNQGLHAQVIVGEVIADGDGFGLPVIEQREPRQRVLKVAEDVPAHDPRCKREPHPEHRCSKDVWYAAPLFGLEQIHRKDGQGECQPLVFVPLLVKEDAAEEPGHHEGETSRGPPEQGSEPGAPGDGQPLFEARVDLTDHHRIRAQEERTGQKGQDHLLYAVLGGHEVDGGRYVGDDVARPPGGRQAARNPGYPEHREDLGPGEDVARRYELEARVDHDPRHERKQGRHGHIVLDEIPAEVGHVEHHHDDGDQAEQDSSEGDSLRGCRRCRGKVNVCCKCFQRVPR